VAQDTETNPCHTDGVGHQHALVLRRLIESTVRFEEIDGRTIQHFSAEVIEARADALGPLSGMEMGWTGSLDKLAAHVRAVTVPVG